MKSELMEILLVTVPGLEDLLRAEAVEKGFKKPSIVTGGVLIKGKWPDVWRANLQLRGASRILVRIGSFRIAHLSKLEGMARHFPWEEHIARGTSLRVDVTSHKSKIYHQKAAAERFEKALVSAIDADIDPEADLVLKIRFFKDVCTISVDSSGDGLHIRGTKQALNKAPLRETLAALILRQAGFKGKEPVVDPMCGSGTLVLEAAEIASRLDAGRSRNFAFQLLPSFDADAFQELKDRTKKAESEFQFYGFDRDAGAVKCAISNAERADVDDMCSFTRQTVSDLTPPDGPKGLVIVNPPYGIRIGDQKKLAPLYQKLGHVLKTRFAGWRVAILTNTGKLAEATDLPFKPDPVGFSHGGIKVKLYQTDVLEERVS